MSKVLLLTSTGQPAAEILPSLSLLDHAVRLAPASAEHVLKQAAGSSALADGLLADAVLVDARHDLVRIRQLFGQLDSIGVPVLAIVTEGGWAAVTADWGTDDVILHTAGPGEVEARIRLAIGRSSRPATARTEEVRSGELVIDEVTYSAKIRGVALDLTFKEFELLKFLAQHPRRVFTRSQLLQEVWGYDYFGGTRTVDVHVRRLRAKLGTENEALIGTVRNVGYKFVPARPESDQSDGGGGRGQTQQADGSGGISQASGDDGISAAEGSGGTSQIRGDDATASTAGTGRADGDGGRGSRRTGRSSDSGVRA